MAKHMSIPTGAPIEVINVTPLNPLISKCVIKVCYIGPNRNGSLISKDVALDLANTLPGSPIVGYYNKEDKDFEEHNRTIKTSTWEFNDDTRPYGFVDLNPKTWFQKFFDDGVEHEYLVTEGWLWTGQYPETKRIIQNGNNQSMELDEKTLQGDWTFDNNLNAEFFIINEAIISKLCILGENFEPCFEGATISKFALDEGFNQRIFELMREVKKLKGGDVPMDDEKNLEVEETLEGEAVNENTPDESAAEPEVIEEQSAEEESSEEPEVKDEEEAEEPASEEETEEPEEKENSEENEDEENQFSLSDFQDLTERFSTLEANFAALQATCEALKEANEQLTAANESLTEFKNATERAEKQRMIDSFYMLSDEDKADVIEHIDEYSIDDIEAKLSVICVRNKLDLSEKSSEESGNTAFSLDSIDDDDDDTPAPAWVAALQHTKRNDR